MSEQNGSEFMGELIETVDMVKAEQLAIIATATEAQKAAIEKAEGFGWIVTERIKDTVVMGSNGKKMRIDSKGKRVKEVRI